MRRRGAMMAAGLALAGCSVGSDMPLATAAAARFHAQLDAGQFAPIYAATAPMFKAATPADRFLPILAAVHRKLGAFRNGTTAGWNETVNLKGHFLVVRYQSRYERGDAAEVFSFAIGGGKATIVGYDINSPTLILS